MAALKTAVESLARTMALELEPAQRLRNLRFARGRRRRPHHEVPDADRQIAHWKDLSIGKHLVTGDEIANVVSGLFLGILPR